jgi:phosphoadenosine phosphosulfate reductase
MQSIEQLEFPDYSIDALVSRAVALLKAHEPPEGYYGCFSGGKDSCVIKELARLAGVKVVWHYNVTGIDPPELVRFIKEHHRDVVWEFPKIPLLHRVERWGLPTSQHPWCCRAYKERRTPKGQTLIMGVRSAESRMRAKNWREVGISQLNHCFVVAPILQWRKSDVWTFIRGAKLPYCELYDEGIERLGCIGCAKITAKQRAAQFRRWPRYEQLWRRAAGRYLERRPDLMERYGDADKFFEWWMSKRAHKNPVCMATWWA